MRTELSEEESAAEARRRAAVEDEPGALLASYRRRLRAVDLPVSRMAWAGAMAVFGLALVLRLWGLGSIGELIFDETYYVKDGYSVFTFGYERAWPEDADDSFNAGDPVRAGFLGLAYSLGLGIPFLLVALGFGWATKAIGFLRRHIRVVNILGGVLLILLGVLMVTGLWTDIMSRLTAVIGSVILPL